MHCGQLAPLTDLLHFVKRRIKRRVAPHPTLNKRGKQAHRAKIYEHGKEVTAGEEGQKAALGRLVREVGAERLHRGRGNGPFAQQRHEHHEAGKVCPAVNTRQQGLPSVSLGAPDKDRQNERHAEQVILPQLELGQCQQRQRQNHYPDEAGKSFKTCVDLHQLQNHHDGEVDPNNGLL